MSEALEPGDWELAERVRVLAKIMVPVAAELRKASADGVTAYVIDYLRSDRPLSSGDRDMLADLIEGVVTRPAGRPEDRRVKARRGALERDFKAIREHGGSPKQAWMFIAAREFEQLGADAFAEYGFKPKGEGDVADLAARLSEWNRRSRLRK